MARSNLRKKQAPWLFDRNWLVERTAAYFTWEAAAENLISKLENQARLQRALGERRQSPQPEPKEPIERRLLGIEAVRIGTIESPSYTKPIDKDNGATGQRLSIVGC